MPEKLTKEQYRKLFQQLPEELKDQILSEETANNVFSICDRNDIEQISVLASESDDVLLGLLPPDKFQESLEEKLNLNKETAKKVAREVYRLIFYPVKENLEKLYRIEIAPLAEMKVIPPATERPPTPPREEDVYREAIEEKEEDVYKEPIE